MQKYAQSSWAHFTQNFLNRKRNIDMLKHLQPEKYAKAFAFPYLCSCAFDSNKVGGPVLLDEKS